MIIDSHQHFWRISDRHGLWPPQTLGAIHRDFLPADLVPTLTRCGVDGTVLVQSLESAAETDRLLQIAQSHDFVLGVVGWVDVTRVDAPLQIEQLASNSILKGLRPMLQDLPDEQWSIDPAYDVAARAMVRNNLAFDALVRTPQLPSLRSFASRHPSLRIVIDHAAKPPVACGDLSAWRDDIASLADLPQVHCKLSGLLTEAGPGASLEAIAPCVAHLFHSFGPERLFWGSDWPVLELSASYDAWFQMAQALCKDQLASDASALAAIFGGNARRFYQLD